MKKNYSFRFALLFSFFVFINSSIKAQLDPIVGTLTATAIPLQSWLLNGNNIGSSNFLGSINNLPVIFKANNTERMRLTTNGYVGIGITNPQVKFEVEIPDNAPGQILASFNSKVSSTITRKVILVPHIVSGYNYIAREGDFGLFWNDATFNGKNGTAGFVIAPWSDGNSGIRLDADGTFQVKRGTTKFATGSAGGPSFSYGTSYIGFNSIRNEAAHNWLLEGDGAHNGGGLIFADIGGNIRLITVLSSATPTQNQTLTDAEMLANTKFLIASDGVVTIGTERITSGPHANYKLSVDGKIVAKEVVTTLINWADFVFDKKYTLMPLAEVETFINKNKHLPGVPSEAEVKANGVNLGEMNKILLQKMEEITLHMIEMQKQNEALQKKIEVLELKTK